MTTTESAPSLARSGGATSPHSGMVPRPAASHPRAGAGSVAAGTSFPPCKTSPAVSDGGRGLSRERTAHRRPWTHEERRQLRALREAGKSYAECAEIMGRSALAIARAVEKFGLQVRRYEGWTNEETTLLLRMKIERKTEREIAAAVDHPIHCVTAKWRDLRCRLPADLVEQIRRDVRATRCVGKSALPAMTRTQMNLYRKLRWRAGMPREVAIAEALR